MIDTFQAKTSGNILILQNKGSTTFICEPQKNKKPKLIDIAFGDFRGIVNDLKNQGYIIQMI